MEGAVLQTRRGESYLTSIRTERPAETDTVIRFATRSKRNERSATTHYIRNSDYKSPNTHSLINKPTSAPNPPKPPHNSPRATFTH